MRTVNNIVLYSSIKEMPITRHKLVASHLLQDSGIGNTLEAIDERLANLMTLAGANKTSEVKDEAMNLRYTFFSMISGIDYKSRAFACLVKSIDGEECNDMTNEGLDKVVEKIEISKERLDEIWEEIKKKLTPN